MLNQGKRDYFDWCLKYSEFVDELHFYHPYANYMNHSVMVEERPQDDTLVEYLRVSGEVITLQLGHFYERYGFDPNDVPLPFLVARLQDLLADRPRV